MDRNTAAALVQNLSNAFSDIGQIFDPRMRAQADQQRLAIEGLRLKNANLGISNQYDPLRYQAEIGLKNAQAATEGTQQGLYKSQTAFQDTRNKGLDDLYKSTGLTGFVKEFEGFNPNAYPDGAQTSIGYGTKARPGETSVTSEEGERRLAEELQSSANRINTAVSQFGANLSPQQRDAMISFDYNTGRGVDLIKRFGNNPEALTAKMLEYTKSEGQTLPGLQRRRAAEVDLFRSAILSSVAGGGGDPQQLTNALNTAKAAQIFYNPSANPDDILRAQAATGTAKPGFNTVAGQTAQEIAINAPKLENDRAIAAGDALVKLIGGSAGSSNGLGLPKTAPKSFNDINKVAEEAQAASFRTFGVPLDEEGAPEQDPYAPERRTWSQSYANARRSGMMPLEAEAAANVHHFGTDQPTINSENTFRFGFGKDPSIPVIKNAEPLPVSPAFGADPNQSAALIQSIPGIFGFPSAQQPGAANTPPPVTGVEQPAQPREQVPPPMLQRPVEQPALPARASDQFKRREGSAEKKARLGKEKEIASLEADIQEAINTLNTGSVDTSGVNMMMGGMGGAFIPQPQSVKLSDDGYNRVYDRLKKMEAKLEKLKGGSDQSGQPNKIGRFLVE